jgi:hypothetical protein
MLHSFQGYGHFDIFCVLFDTANEGLDNMGPSMCQQQQRDSYYQYKTAAISFLRSLRALATGLIPGARRALPDDARTKGPQKSVRNMHLKVCWDRAPKPLNKNLPINQWPQ